LFCWASGAVPEAAIGPLRMSELRLWRELWPVLSPYLWLYDGTPRAEALYDPLLKWIAHDRVPHRPGRVEPRALNRRPKEYDRLNRPRHAMRQALLRN